jgi:hypothetical protein
MMTFKEYLIETLNAQTEIAKGVPELNLPNVMDNVRWSDAPIRKEKVVVRGKEGRVYGSRVIWQRHKKKKK